jgi:hypothetical protein
MTLSAREATSRLGVLIAAALACWSGQAFGEINCIQRCGNDYQSSCYAHCYLERGAEQKEALRKIDPKLAAALEKRFPKIEDIEGGECDEQQCSSVSVYTPHGILGCNVTRRNPMRLRCRYRHQ